MKLLLLQLYKNYSSFSQQINLLCFMFSIMPMYILFPIFQLSVFIVEDVILTGCGIRKVICFFQKTAIPITKKRSWKHSSIILRCFVPFYFMKGKLIDLGICTEISLNLLQSKVHYYNLFMHFLLHKGVYANKTSVLAFILMKMACNTSGMFQSIFKSEILNNFSLNFFRG